MINEASLRMYLDKWDRKYWTTYKLFDILQKVFYRSNHACEAFGEMCADDFVQKMTFHSNFYMVVVPSNPLNDSKAGIEHQWQFNQSKSSVRKGSRFRCLPTKKAIIVVDNIACAILL